MTARTRSRSWLIGAGVAALIAPLAFVVAAATPASALPGKPHEVYMYKVEQHVDLSGEFPDQSIHTHVYCNPGDIALDGMWRVDHVDQAHPPDTFGDERDVYFTASYGDDVDLSEWHFRMTNFADGDAQIKLFLTCIRGNVEQAFGHQHGIDISSRHDFANPGLLAGNLYDWDHPFRCAPGYFAVAPGFNLTSNPPLGFGKKFRLVHNWPSDNTFTGWHWGFYVEDNVDITTYFRCLSEKVLPNGNGPHSHKLAITWRPNGFTGIQDFLSVVGTSEKRRSCDENQFGDGKFFQDYKAMVGAWWIDDYFHVWWLGMDPRPKTRAYKFWWDGGGNSSVWTNILCIRARTGKQIAP